MAGSSTPDAPGAQGIAQADATVRVGGQAINPLYTQQQNESSFAPLQMLQQYRQTGLIPEQQAFKPFDSSRPSNMPPWMQPGGWQLGGNPQNNGQTSGGK